VLRFIDYYAGFLLIVILNANMLNAIMLSVVGPGDIIKRTTLVSVLPYSQQLISFVTYEQAQ